MRLICLKGKDQTTVVRTILDNSTIINLLIYSDEENIERALKKPRANYFDLGSLLLCFQTTDNHLIPWNKIHFVRLAA